MIYTKQNAAGSPASDFDEIGDPFAPRGERLHDRPNAAAVAAEIDAMNHRFDDLHIYDTPIHGPANAAMPDVRGELEREMRQRYVGGPTVHADGSVNPMEDGHLMPTTYEN